MRTAPTIVLASLCVATSAQEPASLAREDVREPMERAADYLVGTQRPDGSWGSDAPECLFELGFSLESYYSWKLASQGLACMGLAVAPETPERRAALARATEWLCSTRLPERDSDWDVDYVWSALYGFVATLELQDDPRFAADAWQALLQRRCEEFLDVLRTHQAASGGWAYYDGPPYGVTPNWATSFCTALVLPSLVEAQGRGYDVSDRMVLRARRYLKRCALPNGAYSYDLDPVTRIDGVEHINRIEGSLGRTQVGNWARRRLGDPTVTDEVLREGIAAFFEHHGYLDHVRTRPIPHEGFHANAGYFYFFGHYYAALAISELPEGERERWHARLRPHLVKTQWENGGMSDFLDTPYLINASTSFFLLALDRGLGPSSAPRAPLDPPRRGDGEEGR